MGLWRKMENNFTQPSSTIYLVSFATIGKPISYFLALISGDNNKRFKNHSPSWPLIKPETQLLKTLFITWYYFWRNDKAALWNILIYINLYDMNLISNFFFIFWIYPGYHTQKSRRSSKILPLSGVPLARKKTRNFKRILFFFFLYIPCVNFDKLSMNIKGT